MRAIGRRLTLMGAIWFILMTAYMAFQVLNGNEYWFLIFPIMPTALLSASMFDDYFMTVLKEVKQ